MGMLYEYHAERGECLFCLEPLYDDGVDASGSRKCPGSIDLVNVGLNHVLYDDDEMWN